jgi:hypothetical protein
MLKTQNAPPFKVDPPGRAGAPYREGMKDHEGLGAIQTSFPVSDITHRSQSWPRQCLKECTPILKRE